MRISGYGAGFGQPEAERDRAAAFRSRHSVGQRVKGRILRREANGLYWVQVGGEEMLARLEVQAEPGDQLFFLVRALTPEILLQVLSGETDAGDLPGLVQRFRAAREVFEIKDSGLLSALCSAPSGAQRREALEQALGRHPEAAERHAKAQDYLAHINALAPEGLQALYLPWLTPSLRRQEMLRRVRPDGSLETALSAADPACGGLEARLTVGTGQPHLRLAVEHPEQSGPLQVELAAWAREDAGQEPEILSPTRLKSSPLGGVLGELFGSAPQWTSGGLNTRV